MAKKKNVKRIKPSVKKSGQLKKAAKKKVAQKHVLPVERKRLSQKIEEFSPRFISLIGEKILRVEKSSLILKEEYRAWCLFDEEWISPEWRSTEEQASQEAADHRRLREHATTIKVKETRIKNQV